MGHALPISRLIEVGDIMLPIYPPYLFLGGPGGYEERYPPISGFDDEDRPSIMHLYYDAFFFV